MRVSVKPGLRSRAASGIPRENGRWKGPGDPGQQRKRRKELEELERTIESLEQHIESLEEQFTKTDPADYQQVQALKTEYDGLKADLAELYEEWESLAEDQAQA